MFVKKLKAESQKSKALLTIFTVIAKAVPLPV